MIIDSKTDTLKTQSQLDYFQKVQVTNAIDLDKKLTDYIITQ